MFLFLFSHASIGPRVPRGPHKNDKARDEKSVKKEEREKKKNFDRKPFWGSITAFSLAASWVELSINIYWANLFAGAAWKRLSLGLDSFSLFIFFWFIFWFYVVDVMDFFFLQSFTLPWSMKVIAVLFTRFIIFNGWSCCSVLVWTESPGAYICREYRWNERNLIASESWKTLTVLIYLFFQNGLVLFKK